MIRFAAVLTATLALAACATPTSPQSGWEPRGDADFAADNAACTREASEANLRSPDAYSNATFGAAAAAGRQLDQDYRPGTANRVFAAVRDSCMERKGWKPVE